MKKKEDEDINSLINRVFYAWGLQNRLKELDIKEAWPELMGKGVAYRTENLYIQNKILHLKLNSSVMRDELQYGKAVIINRVNQYVGFEIMIDVWFE